MKKIPILIACLLSLAVFSAAAGMNLDVREHTLSNGMKILMVKKPGVPRVVCHVYFRVGSINERPGITGSAHVHEHLMFKGTKTIGVTDFEKDAAIDRRIDELMMMVYKEKYWKKGGDQAKIDAWQKEAEGLMAEEKKYTINNDLWNIYVNNGGTGLNASTGEESTGYYVTLPANKVELQMLLESDRMMNAYFREFYSEKNVIMEERRLSENSPGSLFEEQVNAAFFAASPYHWDVIGWMDDLRKMTKEDLVDFHNRYYVPNNAVGVYVGDFEYDNIIALAEKYFGRIPKGPELEPIRTMEPPQYSEKRMYGGGQAPTSLTMMFHIPPDGDRDVAALKVMADALGSETGRLYKGLVREKEMAVNAMAFPRAMAYVGSFQFRAEPRLDKNVKPEDLEAAIWQEIDRIKKEGLTANEIQKAKNRSEASFIRSMQNPMGVAMRIGRAELYRGWRSLADDVEAVKAVTNEDIMRAASAYFVKDNSLTAIYTRKAGR